MWLDKLFKVSRGASLDRYYVCKLFGFGVFLHRLHQSDPDRLFHSHPWDFVSITLSPFKVYFELILDANPKSSVHFAEVQRPRIFRYVKASNYHRVHLMDGPMWTLVIHGRKYNQWQIVDGNLKVVATQPWEGEGEEVKDYTKAEHYCCGQPMLDVSTLETKLPAFRCAVCSRRSGVESTKV